MSGNANFSSILFFFKMMISILDYYGYRITGYVIYSSIFIYPFIELFNLEFEMLSHYTRFQILILKYGLNRIILFMEIGIFLFLSLRIFFFKLHYDLLYTGEKVGIIVYQGRLVSEFSGF